MQIAICLATYVPSFLLMYTHHSLKISLLRLNNTPVRIVCILPHYFTYFQAYYSNTCQKDIVWDTRI